MLEILQFIFSDFWHFIGALILLYAIGGTLRNLAVNVFDFFQPYVAKAKQKKVIKNFEE